ncbi:MAG: T9SS type A sorting domain-containing protein [Candidatus Cloacimonetes bacterium]|nr:T9SS type A sorting domain-containing protein [Candidatus Cloacimonadota bacterium]
MRKPLLLLIACFMAVVPVLSETLAVPPSNFYEHNAGSEENPFLIANLRNLRWLSETENIWGHGYTTDVDEKNWIVEKKYHFIQIADIDATETIHWNDGKGFRPIGLLEINYYSFPNVIIKKKPFFGYYNGNYHSIKGLYINSATDKYISNNAGFFGFIVQSNILNIRLDHADITGNSSIGSIVAQAYHSIIRYCSSNGYVTGVNYDIYPPEDNDDIMPIVIPNLNIGGLIGLSYSSEIEFCYVQTNIKAKHDNLYIAHVISMVGGLVAIKIKGSLKNSFFYGDIDNFYNASTCAGISSEAIQTEIRNVYVTSRNRFANHSSGLVNFIVSSEIRNCFWDTDATGIHIPFGYPLIGENLLINNYGMSTDLLKIISTFENNGWDFENVWKMDSEVNDGYPFLRNILEPITSTIDDTIYPLIQSFVSPNPVRGGEVEIRWQINSKLPKTAYVVCETAIRIYNVRGQLIRASNVSQTKNGNNIFVWDRRDISNLEVPSGLYFYRISSAQNENQSDIMGRFVIIK